MNLMFNDYPEEATKIAKQALDWKEKYPDEVKAGTPVGWARARQLANKQKISYDIVKRMARFVRHEHNKKLDPNFKDTPWKDRGYMAWAIWGGDPGINWAINKVKQIEAKLNLNEGIYNQEAKQTFTFDTEFIEDGKTIDLISIGIVNLNTDETFYMISSEFDATKADDWVKDNVLAKLNPSHPRYTKQYIKECILEFCGENPEFWAYYASYDWIVFCQLFGKMIDLPSTFPMICFDIKQEIIRQNINKDQLPPDPDNEHNALDDAKWNALVMKQLFPDYFKKEEQENPLKDILDENSSVKDNRAVEQIKNTPDLDNSNLIYKSNKIISKEELDFLTRHH